MMASSQGGVRVTDDIASYDHSPVVLMSSGSKIENGKGVPWGVK